ncbi:MAG TPA: hypothetical protein PKD98_23020, partial [Anaerolineae bacterium]|nr:hypothetical protein [Anaerolineae bacterium]
MKRATHQRLSRTARLAFVGGLICAIAWNLTATLTGLGPGWPAAVLPLPGLLAWLGLAAAPAVSARPGTPHPDRYRLLYSSPAGWQDERVRQALLTLVQSGAGLDIIWARDGEEVAC